MTETVTENADVASYLAAVREALLDLSASDHDDLLEDLEAHLYEVVAESGGASLESSLGSPASYADELRASAGLEPAPSVDGPLLRGIVRRVSTSPMWHAFGRSLERPAARSVREFLPTLRPGWWVLRGWLALFVIVVWLHGGDLQSYRDRVFVPTYHGNWVIGIVAVILAVVCSVSLGLRTAGLPQWARRTVGTLGALIVVLALARYGDVENVSRGYGQEQLGQAYPAEAPQPPYPGITVDGRHPINIYPYDEQGHLLHNVRLFDDQGRPLQGLARYDAKGQQLVKELRSDAAGAIVANEYPQVIGDIDGQQLGLDANGNPAKPPTAGPSASAAYALSTPMPTPTVFVPPMAGATPTSTTTAAPTPSPSLTPAAKTSAPARAKGRAKVKPRPTSP